MRDAWDLDSLILHEKYETILQATDQEWSEVTRRIMQNAALFLGIKANLKTKDIIKRIKDLCRKRLEGQSAEEEKNEEKNDKGKGLDNSNEKREKVSSEKLEPKEDSAINSIEARRQKLLKFLKSREKLSPAEITYPFNEAGEERNSIAPLKQFKCLASENDKECEKCDLSSFGLHRLNGKWEDAITINDTVIDCGKKSKVSFSCIERNYYIPCVVQGRLVGIYPAPVKWAIALFMENESSSQVTPLDSNLLEEDCLNFIMQARDLGDFRKDLCPPPKLPKGPYRNLRELDDAIFENEMKWSRKKYVDGNEYEVKPFVFRVKENVDHISTQTEEMPSSRSVSTQTEPIIESDSKDGRCCSHCGLRSEGGLENDDVSWTPNEKRKIEDLTNGEDLSCKRRKMNENTVKQNSDETSLFENLSKYFFNC